MNRIGKLFVNSSFSVSQITKAQLVIENYDKTVTTKPHDKSVKFMVDLSAGNTTLRSNLYDKDDNVLCGAMYVKVSRKN